MAKIRGFKKNCSLKNSSNCQKNQLQFLQLQIHHTSASTSQSLIAMQEPDDTATCTDQPDVKTLWKKMSTLDEFLEFEEKLQNPEIAYRYVSFYDFDFIDFFFAI